MIRDHLKLLRKEFLGPRETFEVYEKRTHSPLNARIPSPLAMVPAEQQQQFPSSYPSVAFVPIQQEKRKGKNNNDWDIYRRNHLLEFIFGRNKRIIFIIIVWELVFFKIKIRILKDEMISNM